MIAPVDAKDMGMRFVRPEAGAIAVGLLVWTPLALIAGVLAPSALKPWCLGLAVAPYVLGAFWLFVVGLATIQRPEHIALAIVFGVPCAVIAFGTQWGLVAIGLATLIWVVARLALGALERRRTTQPSPGASYIGGLLIEPRHPPQGRRAHHG